jgi:transposase
MHKLIHNERNNLVTFHRNEPSRHYADKIKSILLLDDGYSYKDIASILLLDDQTVRNYENIFVKGGLSLLTANNYLGNQISLSASALIQVDNEVASNFYDSSEEIVLYIQKHFNKTYSVSGVTKLLKSIEFSYKKTKIVPEKANIEKQKEFIQTYKKLKKTKDVNDPILFMDASHQQYNSSTSYCWVKTGKDKPVPAKTGRKRININGVLDIENLNVISRLDETINAQSTIELFKTVEQNYSMANTIYVIADNAKYYKAKVLNQYLEHSKIEMIFLPTYSPNLNIIERLWKFFKKKMLSRCEYKTFKDFKKASIYFLDNIHIHKKKLETLCTDNFHLLGIP